MSILNVDKIQPIGGGSTITVDATDIQATSATITASSFVGGLPITNGADNRVITASSASAIQGEANLTFDGNTLALDSNTGTINVSRNSRTLTLEGNYGNEGHPAIKTSSGHDLRIFTSGNNERLRIASNGTIGINSTSPGALLDLSSSQPGILFSETGVSANNGKWLNQANASELYWQAQTDAHAGGGNLFKMTRSAQQIQSFEGQQSGVTWFTIRNSDKTVGINEASNINAKLHVQHDALNENILYATRYNDQANDKPIFAVTEATMDGFVDSGLVIGSHNRSMRLGAVFDNNAGVTTSTAGGITINTSATGASSTINNIGINTGRPANALVVKHSEPTIRLVNTSQPNAVESGRIRFNEYDTDYQGGYIHYNGLANLFYIGVHNNVDAVTANDNNVITIERTTGITTFKLHQ